MSKVLEFSRPICREVRQDALLALAPIAERFGLTVEAVSGTFSGSCYTLKLAFNTEGQEDRKRQEFVALAPRLDLPPDAFGKKFLFKGSRYTVTGINARSRKFPVNAERDEDGKGFKFPASIVRKAM